MVRRKGVKTLSVREDVNSSNSKAVVVCGVLTLDLSCLLLPVDLALHLASLLPHAVPVRVDPRVLERLDLINLSARIALGSLENTAQTARVMRLTLSFSSICRRMRFWSSMCILPVPSHCGQSMR